MPRSKLAVLCLLASTALAGCSVDRDAGDDLDVLVPPSSSKQGKDGKGKPKMDPKDVAWRIGILHQDLPLGFGQDRAANGERIYGQSTLGFCGAPYPSERLRIARDAVLFPGPAGSIHDAVSSEAVVYRRGGAAQALKELRAAISSCPYTWVPHGVAGSPAFHADISMLPVTKGWRTDAFAFAMSLSGGYSWTGAFVYQVKGDVLTAVRVSSNHRSLLGPLGVIVNRRLEKYAGRVEQPEKAKPTKSSRPA